MVFQNISYHLLDSSVGIETGLRAGWPGFDSHKEREEFSLLHSTQTGSGAHPAFYPMGVRGSFSRDRAAGAWSWPLTSIWYWGQEWWNYTSTSPYVFMAWYLINWAQGIYLPMLQTSIKSYSTLKRELENNVSRKKVSTWKVSRLKSSWKSLLKKCNWKLKALLNRLSD
jgi:hypothetical protein